MQTASQPRPFVEEAGLWPRSTPSDKTQMGLARTGAVYPESRYAPEKVIYMKINF